MKNKMLCIMEERGLPSQASETVQWPLLRWSTSNTQLPASQLSLFVLSLLREYWIRSPKGAAAAAAKLHKVAQMLKSSSKEPEATELAKMNAKQQLQAMLVQNSLQKTLTLI
jgi:hypothetical protein